MMIKSKLLLAILLIIFPTLPINSVMNEQVGVPEECARNLTLWLIVLGLFELLEVFMLQAPRVYRGIDSCWRY